MSHQLLIDTAVLAGEIMLKSGAETYRVEDTMSHILQMSKAETVESIVFTTAIMVTVKEEMQDPVTVVKRVQKRQTNLNRIVEVNQISRKFCSEEITLEEAHAKLLQIPVRIYRPFQYQLAMMGAVAGFVLMKGGESLDMAAALVSGGILGALYLLGKRLQVNLFILNTCLAAAVAWCSQLIKHTILPDLNLDILIIASIMPLVPGVAITNAVRDTLNGDYISGSARILEALLIAVAIAFGVGLGIAIYGY